MKSQFNTPRPVRLAFVVVTVTIAVTSSTWTLLGALRAAWSAIRSPGRASVEELVVAVSSTSALALLLWVTLGLLASIASSLPGPIGAGTARVRDAIAPEVVRRGGALLLGVSVMSACGPGGAVADALPAHSAPVVTTVGGAAPNALDTNTDTDIAPAPDWLERTADLGDVVEPAPVPDWTPTPVRALPPVSLTTPRALHTEAVQVEVTVRRGDTLWDLAAASLPPEATDAEIASEWQEWYHANRHVIGPDPDLILPGQVLMIPVAADASPTGGSR